MAEGMTSALISAEELHGLLGRPDLRVLDASYNQPDFPHGVPGAVDFDIDDIADPQAPLAHTIPSAELFAEKVGKLGVGNDDTVVVYDRAGLYMAASRAWWMFRLFGHDRVRVLNGGLPAWVAAGYPVKEKSPSPSGGRGAFAASFRPHLVKYKNDIRDNIGRQDFTVLDARDARRYAGEVPEPKPGLATGHIPLSLSVPFMTLIDPATGKMKPPGDLGGLLQVDRDKPIAVSCGSGVTACVVALALFETGTRDAAIYDGSWTEWGGDPELPKTTGSAP